MNNRVDKCAAIVVQAMRITAKGKWHVFCEYAGHIDCLTVRWELADTDYAQPGRYSHEGMRAYLGWGDPAGQLAAIRDALGALEMQS
jgi:hypothetical protein